MTGTRDQTPRGQGSATEAALRASHAELDRFFALVPDLVCIAGTDGHFKRLSAAWVSTLGFTVDELLARPFESFIHPDDVKPTRREVARQIEGEATFRFVNRYLTKAGAVRWLEWAATPAVDGTTLFAAARDITEHRQAEERLRALAAHLVAVREEDHTRMAREIHDELGQGLSALRLDLTWMARKLPKAGAALRRRADASIALIDEMIAVGQRIAAGLRPPILDDLGLVPAMEWYVQRLAARSGIPITFDAGSAPAPDVSGPLAVTAYRITQEALTNVVRHAQAKKATVRITGAPRRGTTVRITMPFPPPTVPAP